jgi:hypothetical protein
MYEWACRRSCAGLAPVWVPLLSQARDSTWPVYGRNQPYTGDAFAQRLLTDVAMRNGRDLADLLAVLAALARRRDPAYPATARFRDSA